MLMREVWADAPGRVNLIGEHTDYHQGFVLPLAIPQRTRVHLTSRSDQRVQASSSAFGDETREFVVGAEMRDGTWLDYVQGVTWVLDAAAPDVSGFVVHIESAVPLGKGLASSAALEVSLLRALRELWALPFDDIDLARFGQRVETDFVGAPVGIMDHMACSLAHEREALFLDTRSLSHAHVPLPAIAELVVIDSGISHRHAGGAYATRRRESFAAAALLGVRWLRDVKDGQWDALERLPPLLARRARHVVTEHHRVSDAVDALKAGDIVRVGMLLNASHASMRDDYDISTPDIDRLVALGRDDPDVYGARLTGGGFGGAVVILARAGLGTDVALRILRGYHAGGSQRGSILLPNHLHEARTA